MLNRRTLLTAAPALPFLFARPALAATPEIFATNGLAIHGTDPVAYFTQGEPVMGLPEHSLLWRDAEWRFVSAENLVTFEMDPKAFCPRYGGYCAFALSKGAIATSVPEAWTIHEDRLYLNFSTGVREIWKQDIPGNIERADSHWPDILFS